MRWILFLALATLPPSDRKAFQQWISFLAESHFSVDPARRPPEIIDCAALVRFAYRDVLRTRNAAWAARARLPQAPALC